MAGTLGPAPFECREIGPREVVGSNVLRHFRHVLLTVGPAVGADHTQVGLAELAPMEVDLVERHHQPVHAVVRKLADDAPDAVLVIQLTDLVLFEHVTPGRSLRRRFGGRRHGRSGLRRFCRSGRSQRRRGDGLGVILLFAVGVLNIVDVLNGQHVGRAIGVRETLVAHRLGRDFDHFSLDLRGVGLYDQVLRGGGQDTEQRRKEQQNGSFHHVGQIYVRQI